jgi:hypothetical protein
MKTVTLLITISVDHEDGEHIGDEYAKELLLEVVASKSDQALMGYITVTEEDEDELRIQGVTPIR